MQGKTGRMSTTALALEMRNARVGSAFLVLLPLAYCLFVPVTVHVKNESAQRLSNIAVMVSGVVEQVDVPEPGQTKSVWVRAGGESGVDISYRNATGVVVSCGPYGYLEGGYTGSITFILDQTTVKDVQWNVSAGL